MALVKAGWLWRQSTILRRWKRNWFVLWMDGTLGYYKDDSLQEEEERVLIRYNCREVKTGEECPEMQLPEGQTRDGLLIVFLRDGPRLTLCADSKDEALAWKITILEYSTPVRIYDPYDDYYQIVPPNAHDATYIRTGTPYGAPGVTHVILRDSPYYGRDTGGDIAMGMLAGAATGAALGSLMWMPCWF